MHLIDKIMNRAEFQERPPVLLDIGASGGLHFRWKKIAPYSICIAFDPDKRDFDDSKAQQSHYKKLQLVRCIVADQSRSAAPFYLTASPYCSSFLRPRTDQLMPYAYADKFTVVRETQLPVRSLTEILQEQRIDYVDWFKTDSQGLDLRIFRSMGPAMIRGVKAAEFEPGIMDAYAGEDKLHAVLAFMEQHPFFLSECKIKGTSRVSKANLQEITASPFLQKLLMVSHKKTAGWGELLYLNTMEGDPDVSLRDYLLSAVMAWVNEEYGFAMEVAQKARRSYSDPVLDELKTAAKKKIRQSLIKLRFMEEVKKKLGF